MHLAKAWVFNDLLKLVVIIPQWENQATIASLVFTTMAVSLHSVL
jgi:hypothetical protein